MNGQFLAQDGFVNEEVHTIKVIGHGSVPVAPDMAEVRIGAITENKELSIAQSENAAIIENMKKVMESNGISQEQIKTVHYSIHPQYDYENGKQQFRGYVVEHLLQVHFFSIEDMGKIIDQAVQAGANSISSLEFSVQHRSIYERQALSLSVVDAYQKAEIIAKTLHVTLNSTPLMISEMGVGGSEPIPIQGAALMKSEAATSIQPGQFKINASVMAEFTFEP